MGTTKQLATLRTPVVQKKQSMLILFFHLHPKSNKIQTLVGTNIECSCDMYNTLSLNYKIYVPESFKMSNTTELVSLLSRLDPAALGCTAAMSPDRPMPWINLHKTAECHCSKTYCKCDISLVTMKMFHWWLVEICKLEPVMPSCHKAGCHPAFPLSYTTVAEEVIAVHHSQLIQEELDGALAPSLLWTLTLQRAQHEQWMKLQWPWGHMKAAVGFTCSSKCLMSCSWLRRAWLPCRT